MRLHPAAFMIMIILLTACSIRTQEKPVADLVALKQDLGLYHGLDPDASVLSPEAQEAAFGQFLKEHFGPWNRTEPRHSAKEVFWGLDVYPKKELFGENTLPRNPEWMKRMREHSRVDQYPSMGRKAIAVVNTSMRVLPTGQPAFYDFSKAGEGFPFDYMQNSLVLAGTPLYASHTSQDRAWIMVEARFAYGWVPASDIAWVDDQFASFFQTGAYGAVTRDDVPVLDSDGNHRLTAHIGTILPIEKKEDRPGGFRVIVPARNELGNAVPQLAFLPCSVMEPAPIPATPANFAKLGNAMLGRPYGWGGLYQGRDCSAATMDLMAAFGIYLPRNSNQQIGIGPMVSLKGMGSEAKKRIITTVGTPFLTLVRKPGHIMLYIGSRDGQPLVFHAIWGLKTRADNGYGRKVIGRAVITSLEPGLEMHDLARPEGVLLETVYAITTLPGFSGKE